MSELPPFEISDRLVDDLVVLDPLLATELGIPGLDGEWPDLSPEGHDARADLLRRQFPRLLEAAEVQREQLRARQVREHPRQLALGELEPADRPPELLARARVRHRRLITAPRRTGRPPHDAVAGLGQARQRAAQATGMRQNG